MRELTRSVGKLLREPLVQFVFIGALLFGANALFINGVGKDAGRVVRISATDVLMQKAVWEAQWRRPPTQSELDGLIDQLVRERVLAREAVVMGLDEDDMVIRRRLAQKVEMLTQGLADLQQPSADELRSYYIANREQYQLPARMSFSHVFVNPDERGAQTVPAAQQILATIRSSGTPVQDAIALGDRFMLQRYYPAQSPAQVQRLFGSFFADSLFATSESGWHGPLASGYGLHLVFVHERVDASEPPWDDIEPRVLEEWRSQRRTDATEGFYTNLLSSYQVIIEELGDSSGGSS